MSTDFTRYQPPGVYVEGTPGTVLTTQSAPTTTVTLVAPALGYQIATETQVLTAATPVALTKPGVLADSDPSPNLSVTKTDGTPLVENTDYQLVRGATSSDYTTIKRKSSATTIADGATVIVSYAYADSTYYSPKHFTDYASVESVYGPALSSDLTQAPVLSALSLGARIAFENGATTVLCVATQAPITGGSPITLRQRYQQAYDKLANDYATTLLVPIVLDSGTDSGAGYTSGLQGFITDVKNHCQSQSANGFGRIAFIGADATFNFTSVGFDTIAETTASSRVVLAFPHRMQYFNNSAGATQTLGGGFLAAALAGRLAASEVNRGLTRQRVASFSAIPADLVSQMTVDFKNDLSAAGVCVVEPGRSNTLVCRHGVSTKTGDLIAQEVSITRCYDLLLQNVQTGLDASDLIGAPIDSEMTTTVKGVITGILEAALTFNIIKAYTSLAVRQQSLPNGNPTAIEVVFTYAPFLPLNFITVSFSMDLSTGVITDTSNLATAA